MILSVGADQIAHWIIAGNIGDDLSVILPVLLRFNIQTFSPTPLHINMQRKAHDNNN